MATDIDNIIIVNEQEIITTSIDGYFKNCGIIASFENADLLNGYVFSTDGYEEFTSMNGIAGVFPTTHAVYKIAQRIFAQKTNTGVNKSAIEKLAVLQIKTTDSSIESGLNRIGYADAYQFVLASEDADDILSASEYFLGKRKILHCQTRDADVLAGTTGNIAEQLADGNYNRTSLFYHNADAYSLAGAVMAVLACAVPGKNNGKYNKVSGITVDTLTEPQKTYFEANDINYFTNFVGQAGSYIARTLVANAKLIGGEKIQKQIILDRIILGFQSAGMDALEMQIGYDDRGGAILEGKLSAVLRQKQIEELIKEDSLDDAGNKIKGQTVKVLTVAQTKKDFSSLYASQIFVAPAFVYLNLNGDGVQINLGYSV